MEWSLEPNLESCLVYWTRAKNGHSWYSNQLHSNHRSSPQLRVRECPASSKETVMEFRKMILYVMVACFATSTQAAPFGDIVVELTDGFTGRLTIVSDALRNISDLTVDGMLSNSRNLSILTSLWTV
ncbi:hypothetical protein FHG87_002940 [Trinorchestia longiramus]|nr:hypothetical protein FHG87_002940 [Trinorchestia longiramus]